MNRVELTIITEEFDEPRTYALGSEDIHALDLLAYILDAITLDIQASDNPTLDRYVNQSDVGEELKLIQEV